jgi:C4-dicarboxylate-specific signal transduction histidine kinase
VCERERERGRAFVCVYLHASITQSHAIHSAKTTHTHSHIQPFDVRDCVKMASAILKNQAIQNGLTLEYSVHKDVPLMINSDCNRLKQILINLISNALKFTEVGGVAIRVEVAHPHDIEECNQFVKVNACVCMYTCMNACVCAFVMYTRAHIYQCNHIHALLYEIRTRKAPTPNVGTSRPTPPRRR